MRLTREEFRKQLYAYNDDELFYKKLYFEEKERPKTFHEYCLHLDRDLIASHALYVPELLKENWYTYLEEKVMFHDMAENIMLYKHYRYTPEFVHEHEFFEILCIYDGTAHTSIQGIDHTLHTGDVCIIPPHTKHSVGIFDDSTAFNILIRGTTFQSTFFQALTADSALAQFFAHVLYRKTEGNYLIFHSGEDSAIREMQETMYIEYLAQEKYSYTFLNSMLILFWAMLLRYHENDIESILTKDTSGNSMTEILNYLNQHYQTATLSETAEHFGYSTSHFSTLIKEGTGQTFLQIIRNIKLSQACRALRESTLSNSAICELVGYDSPEHFMRTFKKTYGMTPGEYRRKYKEESS
ncbi:AraC family transcriptional regulator [Blautia sp. MSJ-19]|uniref:AraC family transcriptional regulator n=1 Tax=Blautia sp. MSJ-19 TaxID=2841517 RepID=UPI001C0E9FDE|nr:AraC family transcriptional regulator [Blautia sp. MSJ-19]MBU5480036.1 AraC family transcriptional regulator [Blautia sp. MSJ-19]